ncbi:uncharacterized protein LOC143916154 [Arctopsyche grandis]|uniref:uncharacterized protein LOC143916154 n=1 Tax=Arctopsyche grandis TaxID=121162 RepID=UPI00406D9FAD
MSWKVLIVIFFYTEATPITYNLRNARAGLNDNVELPTNLFDDYVPKNPNSILSTKVTDNIPAYVQNNPVKNPENLAVNFAQERPVKNQNTIQLNGQDFEVIDVISLDDYPANTQQRYPTQNNKPIDIQIQQFPGSNNRPSNDFQVQSEPFENAIVINQRPANSNNGFHQTRPQNFNGQIVAQFNENPGQITGHIQFPQNNYGTNNFVGGPSHSGPQYYGQPQQGNQNINHLIRNGINTLASLGNAFFG